MPSRSAISAATTSSVRESIRTAPRLTQIKGANVWDAGSRGRPLTAPQCTIGLAGVETAGRAVRAAA